MGILNCISGNSIKLQIRFFVKISPPFGKKINCLKSEHMPKFKPLFSNIN